MASLSNPRWQTREERPNQSTQTTKISSKRLNVRVNYKEAELLKREKEKQDKKKKVRAFLNNCIFQGRFEIHIPRKIF